MALCLPSICADRLRNLGARLHVFGCPNDYWMTRAQFDEVVKKAPRCQVRLCGGIKTSGSWQVL
eukprot:363694-Chlamydomonas_euryale.AAC.9